MALKVRPIMVKELKQKQQDKAELYKLTSAGERSNGKRD